MFGIAALCALLNTGSAQAGPFSELFGYHEEAQADLQVIPQWISVQTRAAADTWEAELTPLIAPLVELEPEAQLRAVNALANARRYVVDSVNYGTEDYWALPGQFLANGGDCEDFALFKLYALRALGWPSEALRLVVVQDTQLGQPHAVLAVAMPDGTRILDNQFSEPRSDADIAHYAPVYSVSDEQWWMHLPELSLSPSPSSRPAPAADSRPSGTRQ